MGKYSRKALAVGGLVLAVALGGIAYAYFTTTGSGTATASVGSSSALTLHGSTAGALLPGAAGQTVSFTVDNPSAGHQRVGTVHLDSVDAPSGCNAADFTMPDVVSNQDVAHGTGIAITATGTLTMANNGNQDACQSGALTLHISSN
jgi:hypothetical protein